MRLSISALKLPMFLFSVLLVIVFIHSNSFNFDFRIGVDEYLYTSWLFNYDHGFMRRAFLGEVISFFNIGNDYKTIRFIALVNYLILFSLFCFLLLKSLKKIQIESLYLYMACILCFSFLTSQWLLELGRFDQVVQIFSLITLTVILKSKNSILSFLCIFIFILFSALIHEASLIIFMPTLILIFYMEFRRKGLLIFLIITLLLSIILIVKFGQISTVQSNKIIEFYEGNKKLNLYAVRTTMLSVWDNVLSSYYSLLDNKTYVPIFLSLIFVYPVLDFFKQVFYKKINIFVIFSVSTPIILSLIAFDYYRWIALVIFNITVVIFYLINSEQVNTTDAKHYLERHKRFFIAYALICLVVGPFGVVRFLPNIYNVNAGGLSTSQLPTEILLKLNLEPSTKGQLFTVNVDNAGWIMETNFIQDQHIEKAMKWYEIESALGNPQAKNNLALIYTRGGLIQIDYKKALALFMSIDPIKYPYASNNLGVMYANGFGVEANGKLALSYYLQAAKQGDPAAMYNIGVSYLRGLNGLDKDRVDAQLWFKKAASLGYKPAVNKVKT